MTETFEPTTIISPGDYPTPKEGYIGYVKCENLDEIPDLHPQWMEVDDYEEQPDMVPSTGVFCPAILDDDELEEDYHVETVNVGFNPECVINI